MFPLHSSLRWLRNWWHPDRGARRPAHLRRSRRVSCRLLLEGLEDRLTPSVSFLLGDSVPSPPNSPLASAAFAPQQTFPVGTGPQFVAVGDVNGDDQPDLVATNFGDNTVSVLLNSTAPGATTISFAPAKSYPVDRSVPLLAIADVNGDGRPDLIAQYGGVGASVYLNLMAPGATAPVFASAQTFSPFGNVLISSLAVADVNGDAKPELLITWEGMVWVLLNTTA